MFELRDFHLVDPAVHAEGLKPVSPEDLELLRAERLRRGALEHALANDEQIRMAGSEGRIVNPARQIAPFIGGLRQLLPEAISFSASPASSRISSVRG